MHTRYTRMYTVAHASLILLHTHTHTHIYTNQYKILMRYYHYVLRLSKFFFFSLKTAHKILLEKYV